MNRNVTAFPSPFVKDLKDSYSRSCTALRASLKGDLFHTLERTYESRWLEKKVLGGQQNMVAFFQAHIDKGAGDFLS